MSVYVDPLIPCIPTRNWRHTKSCHLFADTKAELHAFAGKIGLERCWYETGRCRTFPHYDLTERMRELAVAGGAVELDRQAAVEKWYALGFRKRRERNALGFVELWRPPKGDSPRDPAEGRTA